VNLPKGSVKHEFQPEHRKNLKEIDAPKLIRICWYFRNLPDKMAFCAFATATAHSKFHFANNAIQVGACFDV